ncbi:DUF2461 domain-containing protein [Flavobacterium silvaticum]|uniref:DUF2461 domain-containing protein n=1 Tax=Flavobacterium silvaticum TaxID=1852020 RepID=A0A972FNP2_9FLAO|nr:DUF2461 domain-containing protein [Flavobacterium silvaticum]NMH29371.1 DUF2461 domain-containing protein [Flavobacterium silvaticum]
MIEKESLKFLGDLAKNNNRDWFLENKKRYEAYKKNYLEVIEGILKYLVPKDESLAQVDAKKCMFRINRDIRFSKDKSPYKTHMGIWIMAGQKHEWNPGYYVHIEKGKSFIAAGIWQPVPETLKKIRKEIEFFHEDLEAILNEKKFKAEFGPLSTEDSLKTTPKGFEKDHPASEHLKLKSFIARQSLPDAVFDDKNFEKTIADKLSAAKPLNDFLSRSLSNPED